MIKKTRKLGLKTEKIRTITGGELLEIKGGAAVLSLCNSHHNGCNDPDLPPLG